MHVCMCVCIYLHIRMYYVCVSMYVDADACLYLVGPAIVRCLNISHSRLHAYMCVYVFL